MNETKIWLRPMAVAVIAGLSFFIVVELILILPPLWLGKTLGFLSATDTITLMTGSITAAGLSAVAAQVMESARNAVAREKEIKRQSAIQLDSLHAHFNLAEMRRHRNVAYLYLRFLHETDERMKAYARYWITDTDATHVREELLKLLEGVEKEPSSPYTDLAKITFAECDSAVSGIIAFYTRLATHLSLAFPEQETLKTRLDGEALEAVSPFFWSYWQGRLLAFSACQFVYENEAQGLSLGAPFFHVPFQRLQNLLAVTPCSQTNAPNQGVSGK